MVSDTISSAQPIFLILCDAGQIRHVLSSSLNGCLGFRWSDFLRWAVCAGLGCIYFSQWCNSLIKVIGWNLRLPSPLRVRHLKINTSHEKELGLAMRALMSSNGLEHPHLGPPPTDPLPIALYKLRATNMLLVWGGLWVSMS